MAEETILGHEFSLLDLAALGLLTGREVDEAVELSQALVEASVLVD